MAFSLLPDHVWQEIEPLLPPEPARPRGGRPRVSNRSCLMGIVYVLRTGMPWRFIPQELGCGSGVTCWRRFREWTAMGLWPRIHQKLVALLGKNGLLEGSLVVMDSASVRAVFGGRTPGQIPRIAAKTAANGMY